MANSGLENKVTKLRKVNTQITEFLLQAYYVLKLTNKRLVIEMARVAKMMYQHYIGLSVFLSLQSSLLPLLTAI